MKNAAAKPPATSRLNHNSCDAAGSRPFATKMTNIAAITAAFQKSQEGKCFLLCSANEFCSDKIEPEELVITGVIEVRLGKYLVLQSAKPGTTHEMLLRWKNHAGILYPAWQISMKRS
jgi:hypothetical protein